MGQIKEAAITYDEIAEMVEVWEDLQYTMNYDRTHADDDGESFERVLADFHEHDTALGKALKKWDRWNGAALVGGYIYQAATWVVWRDGVAQKRYTVERHDSEWAGSADSA